MEYKRFNDNIVVRIDKGEEIIKSLFLVIEKEKIKLGTISGIGAVNDAYIGIFNTTTKEYSSMNYRGDFEICSLSGNISTKDHEAYIHAHIVIGNNLENKIVGGHLNSATVSATSEIFIHSIEGQIDRKFDDEIGLNLIKFI